MSLIGAVLATKQSPKLLGDCFAPPVMTGQRDFDQALTAVKGILDSRGFSFIMVCGYQNTLGSEKSEIAGFGKIVGPRSQIDTVSDSSSQP